MQWATHILSAFESRCQTDCTALMAEIMGRDASKSAPSAIWL